MRGAAAAGYTDRVTVTVRELKKRLSAYLRAARAGRAVTITERGEVVAELVPPRPSSVDPRFAELIRRGLVTRIVMNDPTVYPPRMPRVLPPGEFERLLAEDRTDR